MICVDRPYSTSMSNTPHTIVSIPEATEAQFDAMLAELRAGGNVATVEPWGDDKVVIRTDAMSPRIEAIATHLKIDTLGISLGVQSVTTPADVSTPAVTRKLADARQLDWEAARTAAQRILRICDDAFFVAPEALDVFQGKIALVCEQMNAIVKALCIRGPGQR